MDHLAAVGDPELREALLFARSHARPVTADELAEAKGLHRNVARSRLERLVEAGLLAVGYERRTGRSGPGAGRPAKTYSVVPQLESIEFPGDQNESLAGLLVDALVARGGEEPLREVGVNFGRELARTARLRPAKSLETGFERVCAAVRRLGYQASLEHADEHGAVIATPTCPLRPLVRARPEAVEIDRGMWAGLASCALEGVEVGRGSLRDARLLRRPRVVQGRARADASVKFLNTFLWYKETDMETTATFGGLELVTSPCVMTPRGNEHGPRRLRDRPPRGPARRGRRRRAPAPARSRSPSPRRRRTRPSGRRTSALLR